MRHWEGGAAAGAGGVTGSVSGSSANGNGPRKVSGLVQPAGAGRSSECWTIGGGGHRKLMCSLLRGLRVGLFRRLLLRTS